MLICLYSTLTSENPTQQLPSHKGSIHQDPSHPLNTLNVLRMISRSDLGLIDFYHWAKKGIPE